MGSMESKFFGVDEQMTYFPKKYLIQSDGSLAQIPDENGKIKSWLTGETIQKYVTHHIDWDHSNNDTENEVLVTYSDHRFAHIQLQLTILAYDREHIPQNLYEWRSVGKKLVNSGEIIFDKDNVKYYLKTPEVVCAVVPKSNIRSDIIIKRFVGTYPENMKSISNKNRTILRNICDDPQLQQFFNSFLEWYIKKGV